MSCYMLRLVQVRMFFQNTKLLPKYKFQILNKSQNPGFVGRVNRSEPAIFTVILIYDDRCSLCCGCMKWIELHAIRKDAFEFIPCRSDERRKRFPQITDEACQQSLHLVLPRQRILKGDEALPEIMKRLRGFRWLVFLFRLPVFKVVLYAIYRWVANNRYIISLTIKPLI